MGDCGWIDVGCKAKELASSTLGDAITKLADAVLEAVGKGIASLGTMWVHVGTPVLTGGGSSPGVSPGDHAPGTDGINTVLGYATWIALAICVLSLIALGARLGMRHRHEAQQHVDRLGVILIAAITISAAVSLVTAVAPSVRSQGSPAVAYIQNSTWWYMVAFATVGVIVGGVRMAWEQRAEPGKEVVRALLTLAVVAGAGLTTVSLLVAAGDAFSVWLLDGSLNCSVADTDGTCFGGNMAGLLALTVNPVTGGLGSIMIIILGLLAICGSLLQILLMIIRGGMLVVLAGVLPVSAAATSTEIGKNMFRKTVGWTLAFILYKPAAAIIYATAFKLAGTSVFKDDGSGLISVITGLTMMAIALVALPALVTLIIPAVSAVASGGSTGASMAAGAGVLATGAIAGGRLSGGGQSSGGPPPSDPSGASPSPGGSGPSGPTGSPGSDGSSGKASGSGPTGGSSSPGGGASTTGAGAGAGASGAAAGGGGAGAAAGAGAVAGPVGAAIGAGVQVAGGAVKSASGAIQSAAETSSGGPDGSR